MCVPIAPVLLCEGREMLALMRRVADALQPKIE